MADIRKRTGKNGTTYQVRYPSTKTKSGYAYATFDTRKQALAFRENGSERALRARGSAAKAVSSAVDDWLDICEKIGRDGREKVEPETLKEYKRRANVVKEYKWSKALPDLEPADIVHFRNWLLENKSRDLARRTLSSFHSVMIEMIHQGFIKTDPAAGVTIKQGGRYEDEDAEVEIPSDDEVRAIYAAADVMGKKNDFMKKCWARYRPMIYLAGFSGMRPSEYRGIAWPHIHEGYVTVRQRADKTGIVGPVKSKAGKRTIYLPRLVTDMLFAWQDHCPKTSSDLVFPTEKGKPILLVNFRAGAWDPLMKEAGLIDTLKVGGQAVDVPKYTPYALRHYFASKLIESGRDLKFIQDTMGHSKIEITLNIYGHLLKDRDEKHKEAAEHMASELLMNRCGKSVAQTI